MQVKYSTWDQIIWMCLWNSLCVCAHDFLTGEVPEMSVGEKKSQGMHTIIEHIRQFLGYGQTKLNCHHKAQFIYINLPEHSQ